jgi:hypothetical protein
MPAAKNYFRLIFNLTSMPHWKLEARDWKLEVINGSI